MFKMIEDSVLTLSLCLFCPHPASTAKPRANKAVFKLHVHVTIVYIFILNFVFVLKTLDTIGNCQRPVFSLGVSQHYAKYN